MFMKVFDSDNTKREYSACFTGHRKIAEGTRTVILDATVNAVVNLVKRGYTDFILGGALGYDTLAANALLILRKQPNYDHIRIHLFLPCESQTKGWSAEDIAEYNRIKELADTVTYISKDYYDGVMLDRNRAMVDASSALISYCTNTVRSGAASTTRYAYKSGLEVIHVPAGSSSKKDFVK